MLIGATIKRLRKEKDLTQEQLADCLGITAQAISQWECGKSAPDISQLPMLADIFEVSTDELLEVDIEKRSFKIDAIVKFANEEYIYNARWQEAVEYLRDGLKKYPSSHKLMYELSNAILCFNSRNNIILYDEVYYFCNRILSQSTDSVLRYKTLAMLALAYNYAGEMDNMLKTVQEMSPSSESREAFMLWFNTHGEGIKANREYLKFLFSQALQILTVFSSSAHAFAEDERIEIAKQIISLIEAMLPDGDYEEYAQYADSACAALAELYYKRGNKNEFFHWLNRHCDFSLYMDKYIQGVHTSPAFRGSAFSSWIREDCVGRCRQNINIWSRDIYDSVRSDAEFINAMNKLKSAE